MENTTCCFFGHREITETDELRANLRMAIEKLITNEGVDRFLFGSKSQFDKLCLALVSELKEKYPHIKRLYVRAEFPIIGDDYRAYLLKSYEDTYYPDKLLGAGRAVYVERNCEMIEQSKYCIVYYSEENAPTIRKSGTRLALDYAIRRKKEVIVFPN